MHSVQEAPADLPAVESPALPVQGSLGSGKQVIVASTSVVQASEQYKENRMTCKLLKALPAFSTGLVVGDVS